jgi:uncharacterized membrane protein
MIMPAPAHGRDKPGRLTTLLTVLLTGLSVLFPLIALLLARPFGPMAVTLALVAVLIVRSLGGFAGGANLMPTWLALSVTGVMAALTFINADLAMRSYPVLMNAAMLMIFACSLLRPPTVIERLARLVEPELPDSGVRYTRTVTWVWCWFFVLNGAVAMWTVLYASLEVWALYNGFIAYILMGLLFAGEFAVRRIVKSRTGPGSGPAAP